MEKGVLILLERDLGGGLDTVYYSTIEDARRCPMLAKRREDIISIYNTETLPESVLDKEV